MIFDPSSLGLSVPIGLTGAAITHTLTSLYYHYKLFKKPKRSHQPTQTGRALDRALRQYNTRSKLLFGGFYTDKNWKCYTPDGFLNAYPETENLKKTSLGRFTLTSLKTYKPTICVAFSQSAFQEGHTSHSDETAATYSYPHNSLFLNAADKFFAPDELLVHEIAHCEQDHLTFGLFNKMDAMNKIADYVLVGALYEAGAYTRQDLFEEQLCQSRSKMKRPSPKTFDAMMADSFPTMIDLQMDSLTEAPLLPRWMMILQKPSFSVTDLTDEEIRMATVGNLYPNGIVLKETKKAIQAQRQDIINRTCDWFQESYL